MAEKPGHGSLTRRQTLKRGAALGGALLWATPAVQSLTMKPAYAQVTPRVPVEGPSFIAMNVVCLGDPFVIKLECNGTCAWEDDPGKFPSCDFDPEGEKADGGADLDFTFTGPDPVTGCVTVLVPSDCEVEESVIKGGNCCVAGDTGTGALEFCPC
ncbi:MAG: hypothetical protein ACRDKB_01865 [Actinomycetota bacterium]